LVEVEEEDTTAAAAETWHHGLPYKHDNS
jgi:hypothetical protein